MIFTVQVRITPRPGILDPQGAAVAGALGALGFNGVRDVRVGRLIVLELEAHDAEHARKAAAAMCDKLLANPVTENYTVDETHGA